MSQGSSGMADQSLNSPAKIVHDKKNLGFGPSGGLSVNGQSINLKRDDSLSQMNTFAAPAAKCHFKVVAYEAGAIANTSSGLGYHFTRNDYEKSGTAASTSTGIHIGIVGGADFGTQDQNRDINMDELHELLGN